MRKKPMEIDKTPENQREQDKEKNAHMEHQEAHLKKDRLAEVEEQSVAVRDRRERTQYNLTKEALLLKMKEKLSEVHF
jgi:hypothetical protein